MPAQLRHVAKGEPAANVLNADFVNALVDASRRANTIEAGGRNPGVGSTPPTTLVKACNAAGPTLPFGSIVRPTGAATGFATETDRYNFRKSPYFNVAAPASDTDPIFIVTSRIDTGAIDNVAIAGIAVARVDVTDGTHLFAKPIAGVTTHLASAESGQARILIKHPPDPGTIGWAVLLLGESPFSRNRNLIRIPIAYCNENEELAYYEICIRGDVEIVSCGGSSSSSSSSQMSFG